MKLLVMALVWAGAAFAQPRAMFPWWDSPLARDLNLTADQEQQIRSTQREFRPRLIDLRAAAEKAESELEDVYNDERIDQKRASDAIERLANARAEMTRAVSQMSLRLRSVLTADQWRELQKRRAEQGPPWRGHGPGRPMRRGPGPPPPGEQQE